MKYFRPLTSKQKRQRSFERHKKRCEDCTELDCIDCKQQSFEDAESDYGDMKYHEMIDEKGE